MENRWKFCCNDIKPITINNVDDLMVENMIWVLCSRIRLCKVANIPNYDSL